jgi:hypothetical protein
VQFQASLPQVGMTLAALARLLTRGCAAIAWLRREHCWRSIAA